VNLDQDVNVTKTRQHTIRWALAALLVLPGLAARAQDAGVGKAAFAQCTACHSVDGSNGVGPSLQGVVGRKVGSLAGFHYSRAMKSTAYSWDAAHLDAYLANPQAAIPGNVMPFSGVADAKQRADLVAYLQTLK
jgi:cytochrome c